MPLAASESRPLDLRAARNLQAAVAAHPDVEHPLRFAFAAPPAACAEASLEDAAQIEREVTGAMRKLVAERLKTTDGPQIEDFVEDAPHDVALDLVAALVRTFSR